MIEIVFSDSALGSLKMAQYYGNCKYSGSNIGVVSRNQNGGTHSTEKIAQSQKQFQENDYPESEKARSICGNVKDLFGFYLMLSVGNISDNDFMEERSKVFKSLWRIYPDFPEDELFDFLENTPNGIESLYKNITNDDEIRIWYSNQPDEMCGLYWFMAELAKFPTQPKTVYIVKLPEYQYEKDDTIISHLSWSEISPLDWGSYTDLTEKTTEVFRKYCVQVWETMQKENAPLRAVLNGKIHSVPVDIYDTFILREIAEQEDEFSEAALIGNILGKYQLGISDSWIAYRIEQFISSGILNIVGQHSQGMPLYHRNLRKTKLSL